MIRTSLPQPTLDTLWTEARAGLIPWSTVQQHQADMMPRCQNHSERPMATYEGGAALCDDCYVAVVEARTEKKG